MSSPGDFRVTATDGAARTAELATRRGLVRTPAYMPVGTAGTVKSLTPEDLHAVGAQIILGNTYHLHLRPGDELVAELGGLHRFMHWDGPILTDSGGYQVFSLEGLRTVTDDGVAFASHIDGSRRFFSPEKVMEIQANLGSDIRMVLDECVGWGTSREDTVKALERTTRWAERCLAVHPHDGALVFGITQGGFHKDLREQSVREITALPFEGYAIGGLSVGESREHMDDILHHTAPLMPEHKPRYLMGVGTPRDIVSAVSAGVDMFDCVLPTRNARNGTLYTSQGKVNIKRAEFRNDDRPLDPACSCEACRNYSRAYLRHLYVSRELLAYRLNSVHNLAYFLGLAARCRQAIAVGAFQDLAAEIMGLYREEA